jgi:hypothetical protein
MQFKNRKGIWHFGFGVFLLILIVIYVLISLSNPQIAQSIVDALKNLFGTFH